MKAVRVLGALWALVSVSACEGDIGDPQDGSGGAGASGTGSNTGSTNTGPGATGSGTATAAATTATGTTTGGPSGCDGGPLAQPIPGCAPAALPSSGDLEQDCVDRINQLRWECQCLPPLARWTEAEACSDQQSADDQASNSPHGNFGVCGENAQNTCPNWGSESQVISGCLQMMWDEGPGEPFSAHGHYINMTNPNYSRVACGFSTSNAGVWANQNFKP